MNGRRLTLGVLVFLVLGMVACGESQADCIAEREKYRNQIEVWTRLPVEEIMRVNTHLTEPLAVLYKAEVLDDLQELQPTC